MKHTLASRLSIAPACAVLLFLSASLHSPAQFIPTAGPGSTNSIPQAQVIQTEALVPLLKTKGPNQPFLIHVGSHILFDEGHIPGSIYAGPGSQPAGLQLLQSAVAKLPKTRPIVLYCGCCPWNRCPNLAPAYQQLHSMGFTDVKVLYLANNFGADWAAKGYPVARTQ
jgi:thiosulfate/3-mercaptopyruvate sulfurtransferase